MIMMIMMLLRVNKSYMYWIKQMPKFIDIDDLSKQV